MSCDGCKPKGPKDHRNGIIIALIVALVVSILCLYFSNMKWLEAWTSYDYVTETYTYEQDGEGINIIGSRNEVNENGTESDRDQTHPDETGQQGDANP